MATITTILETDRLVDSRAVINTNFSNLNTAKVDGAAALLTAGRLVEVASAGVATQTAFASSAVLLSTGSYADPAWLTSLATSKLTGTVADTNLASTAVTPAAYGAAASVATITVDQKGRITAAASVSIAIAASQVTSGTFADALVAASNVTQHQAALSVAWSQLTSVPSTFTPASHVHSAADITTGTLDNARTTAVATNTVSTIVARDASGNFAAGTITATFSGALTGNVTGNVSGTAATITGALALANTPLTTRGDLLVATTATPILGRLAKGTQYQVLLGGATDPTWGAVDLAQASAITGTLPVGNGGTGATTLAGAGIVVGSASLTTAGRLAKVSAEGTVTEDGALTVSSGILSATGLGIPLTTSSSTGTLFMASRRFLHAAFNAGDAAYTNVFLGDNAGNYTLSLGAIANTGVGQESLSSLTTGSANTAIGQYALRFMATGVSNVAVGTNAMPVSTNSSQNTAVGLNTLMSATSGGNNTAIGAHALQTSTIGYNNIAIGPDASFYQLEGANNTVIGFQAGLGASSYSSSNNTFIGFRTGYVISTGGNNVLIGYNTGANATTGSGNIIVGYNISVPSATISNYMSLGDTIYGDLANKRVGIGASNYLPSELLSVVGTGTPTILIGSDQTNARLMLSYSESGGYGFLQGGAWGGTTRPISLQPGGGNLLIGTTTDDGSSKLQVAGAASITGKLDVYDANTYSPSAEYNAASSFKLTGSTVSLVGGVDIGAPYGVWLQARNNTVTYTGSTYPISLNPVGGNVLIGTTVDDGSGSRLQVAGTATAYIAAIYNPTATTGVTSLVVRAGAGQGSAALQTWQNNAGTAMASIDSDGKATITGNILVGSGSTGGYIYGGSSTNPFVRLSADNGAILGYSTNSILFGSASGQIDIGGSAVLKFEAAKLGFFGVTPVVRQTATADAAQILAGLQALGLFN